MVAAKPLVTAALLALVFSAAALADTPTVKFTSADQARAVAALLHSTDFGAGWQGGMTKPSPIKSPTCPGFDPKESDLVVSGHADARYTFPQGGVEFDQDVQVMADADAVATDFERTIGPALARCLAYQLRKAKDVTGVTVTRIPFPPAGTVTAAYRAAIDVTRGKKRGRLVSDYVFFGEGRLEYALNVIAPESVGDELVRFESSLAQILVKRAGVAPA